MGHDATSPEVQTVLGIGREATVHEHGDGRVLKLYHPERSTFAAREANALRLLAGTGVPSASLIETLVVGDREGLVMSRLDGEELTGKLGQEPLRLFGNARRLAELHRRIHAVDAGALPSMREELRETVLAASVDPGARSEALDRVERLPGPDALVHGDFHPGNVLAHGDAWSVVDWSVASRGPPLADVANTYILLAHAEPMGPLPLHVRLARRAFASGYLRAYAATAAARAEVRAWLLPMAIARRQMEFPTEGPVLERMIRRATS